MTIQQLEYIVAVNKWRHFVTASEKCGVKQPTLSMMIQKLEAELGVAIFDRSKHPVRPTPMGIRIIEQAEITLKEVKKVKSIVVDEEEGLQGTLTIGVIPTLAPYVIPEFIHHFKQTYGKIELGISELTTESSIEALNNDKIDLVIAATPLEVNGLFEVPVFYEKFVAYFSKEHPLRDLTLSSSNMPQENLWVLEEGHCFRDQIFNFCTRKTSYNKVFESGSIDTLIRIVDTNGGYTVIPEMHINFLNEMQKRNIRSIENPPATREISLVFKETFIKQAMINAVADTLKKFIPEHMIDERLKKFSIKL